MTGSATCGNFDKIPDIAPLIRATITNMHPHSRDTLFCPSFSISFAPSKARARPNASPIATGNHAITGTALSYAMATDLSLCEKKQRFNSAAGFAELNR